MQTAGGEAAMGAVWLVFGVKLRRHWRSWLLLTVLIAVVSGFVLAATAAGDRTDSALPALRRPPRLRRDRVHRPAAARAGEASRGGAGDDGQLAVRRPAAVLV